MKIEAGNSLSQQALLDLYRQMAVIRECERQLARAHQRGLIHGACHTYVGQEAIATGVCAHLRTEDAIFSTHRGHGHALAKGVEPQKLIAELFGRADGISGGRGGSMHLFAPEIGLMGTSGIVGPCILQAAGAGYSFKLLGSNQVAVAFFGDGAVNNGAFHEGLNMASIWNLPVLFVCENNQFATEVPFSYSAGNPSVAQRGEAYGLPSVLVDGNDAIAVHAVAREAIQRARTGGGATLIECKTYRTRSHAEGMIDFTYRTREEVDSWKERDPIERLEQTILDEELAEADTLEEIKRAAKQLVVEARDFAQQSPFPSPDSAATHVYCQTGSSRSLQPPAVPTDQTRKTTYMKATHEALAAEMAQNPRIFVLGEGIGERGGNFATTTGLFEKHGAVRLCDTPICERGFVGLAAGAAMSGTRPVVDLMFGDFMLDAVGEIVNQIAKMQYMSSGRLTMPILLRGCIGIGHSAATHHSGSYYPMFGHFPGLRVAVPSTPYDAKGLLTRALRADDPVLFLEHRELLTVEGPVPQEDYEIPFGSARIIREGSDLTVVAIARMVHLAQEACEKLAGDGVSVELIDPRTIAPLDTEAILASVQKTGRLLIVDETYAPFGIGAEIAARVADAGFDDLDAPIRRLNGAHVPTPYSPPLESAVVPDVEDVIHAIKELMVE